MLEVLNTNNFKQKTSEGLVFVDMYADWCGPCKMIAPIIEQLENEVHDVKIVKLNVDESPEIAAEFSVRSIPTFILLKDGELIVKDVGTKGRLDYYVDLINKNR